MPSDYQGPSCYYPTLETLGLQSTVEHYGTGGGMWKERLGWTLGCIGRAKGTDQGRWSGGGCHQQLLYNQLWGHAHKHLRDTRGPWEMTGEGRGSVTLTRE